MFTQSQSVITAFELNSNQVKDLIKGEFPKLFSDWYIINSNVYLSKENITYQIVAICSDRECNNSTHFLYLICDNDFGYKTLGKETYSDTLGIIKVISLIDSIT